MGERMAQHPYEEPKRRVFYVFLAPGISHLAGSGAPKTANVLSKAVVPAVSSSPLKEMTVGILGFRM